MKKQTPTEWLLEQLKSYSTTLSHSQDCYTLQIPKDDMAQLIEKAQEMESELVADAWIDGLSKSTVK